MGVMGLLLGRFKKLTKPKLEEQELEFKSLENDDEEYIQPPDTIDVAEARNVISEISSIIEYQIQAECRSKQLLQTALGGQAAEALRAVTLAGMEDYNVEFTLQDGSEITILQSDYWKFTGYIGHKPEECKTKKELKDKMILTKI